VSTSAAQKASTEGLSAEKREFIEAWTEFFASYRRARGRVAAQPDGELTLSQHQVLMALDENEEMRVGELAVAAGIAAPTATRMLDRLEHDGFIERHPSANDRRAVAVSMTPAGEEMLALKRNAVTDKMLHVYEALEPGQRPYAAPVLKAIAEALGEEAK
jgi:DNA-binding MarR family transcriptional regulator